MNNTRKTSTHTPNNLQGGKTPQALQKNIEAIVKLEKESLEKLSRVELLAVRVTNFAGSSPFLIFHLAWFTIWIVINTHLIPAVPSFDPYPFSFLTLVVSLEAIFLTLLVLMSQNRMTMEADKRAQMDLQINLLDEQETTMILRMVKKIAEKVGVDPETGICDDLSKQTDIYKLAQTLNEHSKNDTIV